MGIYPYMYIYTYIHTCIYRVGGHTCTLHVVVHVHVGIADTLHVPCTVQINTVLTQINTVLVHVTCTCTVCTTYVTR